MLASITYPPIPIFELGPIRLSMHGIMAGVGFAVGAWIMLREVRRRGYDAEKVGSALTWALVGAIVGARLFTVPAHLGDPGYGFTDAINPAGFYSILGGFAGGILVGLWRAHMVKLPLRPLLDMAAPGLAIGTVVGRMGDVFIVEHLGAPTTFFLGYLVKPGYDLAPQHDVLECTGPAETVCGIYHHTGLYDLIGAAVLLGVLLWLRKNWLNRAYGQLFSIWVIWYGIQRFLIDFTRIGVENADRTLGAITWSQASGLAAAIGGILLFAYFGRRGPKVSEEEDAAYGAVLA